VRFGDVGDDRQAETETVRTGGPVTGGALEGLEQTAGLERQCNGPLTPSLCPFWARFSRVEHERALKGAPRDVNNPR
jgi:hypothetical protein